MTRFYFYVGYEDGSYAQAEYDSAGSAREAYRRYDRQPEKDAVKFGWEEKSCPATLHQLIRAGRLRPGNIMFNGAES